MKKLFILILLLCGITITCAAARKTLSVEKPDMAAIQTAVLNPKSPFYFPRLQKKFEANDTVMTPQEYRYFYLGYMFQEDYDPYRESKYAPKVEELWNRRSAEQWQKGAEAQDRMVKADLDSIILYSEKALRDNPFDLRRMSRLIHVLHLRGKARKAYFYEYRLENLLGAIKSTGTGESADKAWYVVCPMHEYDLLQVLGYEAYDVKYPSEGIDYLLVKPGPELQKRRIKPADGFFFNVLIPIEQYTLKHPEEAQQDADRDGGDDPIDQPAE